MRACVRVYVGACAVLQTDGKEESAAVVWHERYAVDCDAAGALISARCVYCVAASRPLVSGVMMCGCAPDHNCTRHCRQQSVREDVHARAGCVKDGSRPPYLS